MTLTFFIGLKQPDHLAADVHEVDVDVGDPGAYASAFKWIKGGEEGVENVHFDGLENIHKAVVAVLFRR